MTHQGDQDQIGVFLLLVDQLLKQQLTLAEDADPVPLGLEHFLPQAMQALVVCADIDLAGLYNCLLPETLEPHTTKCSKYLN